MSETAGAPPAVAGPEPALNPFDLERVYRERTTEPATPAAPPVYSNPLTPELAPADAPAMRYVREHKEEFTPAYVSWLKVNWHIWLGFEHEANVMWGKGKEHYSARTIIEYLRHMSALADADSDFKINNNLAPDLARTHAAVHPDRPDFFEFRRMPTSVR